MDETWRPVISYGRRFVDLYEASNVGRIRRTETRRVLKPCLAGRDRRYHYVRLWDGRARTSPVHVLVAEAFMGLKGSLEVNHIDGIQTNNAIWNFEYVTRQGNKDHAVAHAHQGLVAWGEKHGMARLTATQVREIRSSPESDRAIAPRYEISRAYVWQIRARKVWKHLDERTKNTQPAEPE